MQNPVTGGFSGNLGPSDAHITTLGWLNFLASYCPLHQKFSAAMLSQLFAPAINNDCVRLFKNDDGYVCAALIWAQLSDDVSERMVFDRVPPKPSEWITGSNLWFLDVIAPFKHGRMIASHIARNPPDSPFFFARLGESGAIRKVVRGDASHRSKRIQVFQIDPEKGAN